jgi:hypothetical protein
VHVDIDVLDYTKFPIAHEIRDAPPELGQTP